MSVYVRAFVTKLSEKWGRFIALAPWGQAVANSHPPLHPLKAGHCH